MRDVTLESLRSNMGIMTQDNFLFSGTVKENIRYGRLDGKLTCSNTLISGASV